MSKAQVEELIELLRKPPGADGMKSSVTAGAEGESNESARASTPKSPVDGLKGLVAGLGEAIGAVLAGARSVASERDFWKSGLANFLPWALALALAPIVVPWSFERDRAAAKPKISVEYAFLSSQSQAIPNEVVGAVARWNEQPVYRAYRQHHQRGGPQLDVAAIILSVGQLGPKMYQGLRTEMASFRKYLEEAQGALSDQKSRLDSVPEEELRSFAFDVLDDPSKLDESNPRGFLTAAIGAKATAVQQLQEELETLEQVIAESAPEIRVRLTLLNRGATDGLVRHHGEINYRGKSHEMKRAPPPSSDIDIAAVPVFQTNAADYSAGSVGKIEQDSMAEFWYSFRLSGESPDAQSDDLCKPGELVTVTLYDQNRNQVQGTVECNQE